MVTADKPMTMEEIVGMERRLVEVLGTDHCDVADFACRALIRCLGEIKRLRDEARPAPAASGFYAAAPQNRAAAAQLR